MKGIEKRLLLSIMVLAVISGGSVLASPVSAATTYTVDSSMNNAQIQAKIDAASSGDTISFTSGTYNNVNLTINKTLNLIGNGAVLNSININNSVIFTITASGDVEGSGTTIQGFELNNLNSSPSASYGYCIDLERVNNIVINNITAHNGKAAVYCNGAQNVLIKDSGFYYQYNNNSNKQCQPYAVNIMGGNNITVENNTINGANDGVSMASGAANVYVTNNAISNCSYAAFWGGGISNITIANNLINNWTVEGLAIEKAANLTSVINNTFVNGTGDAIYVQNSYAHGPMSIISGIQIINNLFKDIIGAAVGVDKAGMFTGDGSGDSIAGVNNTISNVSKGYVNLYSNGTNLNFTMDSSYPSNKANLTVSNGVSSTAIKTGDKTLYTITVTNRGTSSATNVKVGNILNTGFYSSYASYSSVGSYSNGVWNIGTLSAGETASLVVSATALKSGTALSQASVTADNNLTALSSTIQKTINKFVKLSYANKVSSSKVKKGKYVYLTSTVSNSGKDKSDSVKVKITVPSGMKLIAVNYNGVYNKATKTWTFTVPAGKAYSFVVKAQVTSKGIKKITFNDNGKIQYKYITGY